MVRTSNVVHEEDFDYVSGAATIVHSDGEELVGTTELEGKLATEREHREEPTWTPSGRVEIDEDT